MLIQRIFLSDTKTKSEIKARNAFRSIKEGSSTKIDSIVKKIQEFLNGSEQNFDQFTTILNLKIDGYPFIKTGGFSREKITDISNMIRKVPDVVSFNYNPEDVTPM